MHIKLTRRGRTYFSASSSFNNMSLYSHQVQNNNQRIKIHTNCTQIRKQTTADSKVEN